MSSSEAFFQPPSEKHRLAWPPSEKKTQQPSSDADNQKKARIMPPSDNKAEMQVYCRSWGTVFTGGYCSYWFSLVTPEPMETVGLELSIHLRE